MALGSSRFEDVERFNCARLKGPDGLQNAVTLEGLTFSEAYLKGVLWIALKYRTSTALEAEKFSALALVHLKGNPLNAPTCFRPGVIDSIEPLYCKAGGGWNQNKVLVGNVELVQPVETQLPAFVWLYLVEDCSSDLVAWGNSLLFMSVDGAFKRLPALVKWKPSPLAKSRAVGFTDDVVCVIESDSEIMQGIAKNGWRMFGEGGGRVGLPCFQKAVLALGAHSFHVIRDKLPENGVELVDVMFGPFNL